MLLTKLHELLCQCWEEGTLPQDMRDAIIKILYKNKGDRGDCNNYSGISLLNIVKTCMRVILNRLQKPAERGYSEAQCGLGRASSTIDMLFSLHQLQEKCREQQVPLYIAFIDLTQPVDLVSRSGLFQLLEKIGCQPNLLSMITAFHFNMKSTVRYEGAVSNGFLIKSGVKQGCVLTPTLYGIFFSLVLSQALKLLNMTSKLTPDRMSSSSIWPA